MLRIDTDAIQGLRERLLESGGAPSLLPGRGAEEAHPLEGDEDAKALFDATFEAMFIMLVADGQTGDEEKEVLRGALRELTAGVVRSVQIEKMARDCASRIQREGLDARLDAVAKALKSDETAKEAAFVLAAVMAFADDDIADEENDMLNDFAERLGIDEARADELLDTLEAVQRATQ